jgi:uncharacterized protein (DUF39 family)
VNGELGSSNGTGVTSTVGGNVVIGVEAERVAGSTEVENQQPSIPVTETEHDVSCLPVVSVVHVAYRVCPELAAGILVCLCLTKI